MTRRMPPTEFFYASRMKVKKKCAKRVFLSFVGKNIGKSEVEETKL
jgi:hypothetical protein